MNYKGFFKVILNFVWFIKHLTVVCLSLRFQIQCYTNGITLSWLYIWLVKLGRLWIFLCKNCWSVQTTPKYVYAYAPISISKKCTLIQSWEISLSHKCCKCSPLGQCVIDISSISGRDVYMNIVKISLKESSSSWVLLNFWHTLFFTVPTQAKMKWH